MSIVQDQRFDNWDLSNHSLQTTEYRNVSFRNTAMHNVRFEQATLLNCDLNFIRPLGSTFRLSCKQGANNKLDEINAGLFLLWFMRMFQVSPFMEGQLRAAIGNNYGKVKRLFDRELTGTEI